MEILEVNNKIKNKKFSGWFLQLNVEDREKNQ